MLDRDEDAHEDERLDFVLLAGDFIYETVGEGFQTALDDDLERTERVTQDGEMRVAPALPSAAGSCRAAGPSPKRGMTTTAR